MLNSLRQLDRIVCSPNPRPEDCVLGRSDSGGRIDLDRAQLLGNLHDIARTIGIQQLRPHRNAAGLVARELVRHRVEGTSGVYTSHRTYAETRTCNTAKKDGPCLHSPMPSSPIFRVSRSVESPRRSPTGLFRSARWGSTTTPSWTRLMCWDTGWHAAGNTATSPTTAGSPSWW